MYCGSDIEIEGFDEIIFTIRYGFEAESELENMKTQN